MVNGYVILNIQGAYLADRLYWYEHNRPEDAYVHSSDEIETIKEKYLEIKSGLIPGDIWLPPKTMIPATWSPKEGVKIVGIPRPFPWDD